MSEIVITTLAERPEYRERLYDFADVWPEFMHNDPIGNAFMGQVPDHFPDQCVVAISTRQIVERLCLGPHTVQEHVRAAYDRVGVGSRRELVAALLRGSASRG
jgi:hypothetical protein